MRLVQSFLVALAVVSVALTIAIAVHGVALCFR